MTYCPENEKPTCGIVRDLRSVSSDGCAGEASLRLIKKHLTACPSCREFYRDKRIVARGPSELRPGNYARLAVRIRRRQIIMAAGAAVLLAASAVCVFFERKK